MSKMSEWNILVVEDEPDGQMVVAGLLGVFNIPVHAVGSAEEAITALTEARYDCAIIDLALPGMDGEALLRVIRADPALHDLTCIAITAYHTSTVKQKMIEAGFDAYFAKPIDDTIFVREISRILSPN